MDPRVKRGGDSVPVGRVCLHASGGLKVREDVRWL